jgi:hypothetical protein
MSGYAESGHLKVAERPIPVFHAAREPVLKPDLRTEIPRPRARRTDAPPPLLLRTTTEPGHGGKSGCFQRIRELAQEHAFGLGLAGICAQERAPHPDYTVSLTCNEAGIRSPNDFAVAALTTRSIVVGCSIGRSAGFAPSRIFAT